MQRLKDKEFNKRLLSLVLPTAFQQFMLNLVSASDALMITVIVVYCIKNAVNAGGVPTLQKIFLDKGFNCKGE